MERGQSIDIVAAAYRALHEGEGFDALIREWQARLDAMPLEAIEMDEAGAAQFAALRDLIERVPQPAGIAGVFRAIADAPGAAIVLSPNLTVIAANEAGQHYFATTLGSRPDFAFLDDQGRDTLHELVRASQQRGNRSQAIVRIFPARGPEGLAECFLIRGENVDRDLVALRALGMDWQPSVDSSLQQAFGLTGGECHIARLLFELADLAQVAEARGTSIRTVRTQLHQIFQKTGCGSQVDLFRMLAAMCARASERSASVAVAEGAQPARWSDPLGREAYFTGPYGQIAYSWMGRPGGRPAILAHAPMTGYVLSEPVQAALESADIQLFAPSRPGFGNSAATASVDAVAAGSAVIGAMMDHLGVSAAPLVGLVNGFVPALRFASDHPQRVTQLLNLGACLPLDTPELTASLPPHQRVLLDLARQSPRTCDVVVRLGLRIARARGPEFILARLYAASPEDTATAFDPEILAILMASTSLLTAQDHRAFLRDLSLISYPFGDMLRAPGPPITMIAGMADPVFDFVRVQAEAALNPRLSVEGVAGAGQTVAFSHSEIASAALMRMFDAAH